jgi:hypothetical protein
MIYCVWYPCGGFGHFVNAVLSMHGDNFVRPKNTLKFSSNGNSHNLELVAPKYLHNPENYFFKFDTDKNYSVLIDNGINDETDRFRKFFPDAKTIKICYSDYSWPVVARTMIEKAMAVDFESEVYVDSNRWNTNEDWATREKYFLYLRDNTLRYSWKNTPDILNFELNNLLTYSAAKDTIQSFGLQISDFEALWQQWRIQNKNYIDPVFVAIDVLNSLEQKRYTDIDHSDIWTQAVVYYFIYVKYQFEVPHNDYSNYFTNTKDIAKMLTTHGVNV